MEPQIFVPRAARTSPLHLKPLSTETQVGAQSCSCRCRVDYQHSPLTEMCHHLERFGSGLTIETTPQARISLSAAPCTILVKPSQPAIRGRPAWVERAKPDSAEPRA